MRQMIPHHQNAIFQCKSLITSLGADFVGSDTYKVCMNIIAVQAHQIQYFEGYLAENVPANAPDAPRCDVDLTPEAPVIWDSESYIKSTLAMVTIGLFVSLLIVGLYFALSGRGDKGKIPA